MPIPEYLKDALHDLQGDTLQQLAHLVDVYASAEYDVTEAEEALKIAKERFKQLDEVEIPNLILSNGLSEIRMKDGRKVEVKDKLSVTITDDSAFHTFLALRKEDDIIKLNFAFKKMNPEKQKELFKFLSEKSYDYESEKSVHPSTRLKYFRDLLGLDSANGGSTNEKLVESFAKLYKFHSTKITGQKMNAKDSIANGQIQEEGF